ncbi:MAG: helix-turn-helix transcriptional regulator [Agathobacter sp.]|nr:helix-turn-helix transcriptional regulator [Agathobacter sp.]
MLNQEKTGRFMAEMRRQQNLTQRQLAEQIGVSDKTVSKWETGRSMPDNAILLDVCLLLNISVNELLSGEKFTEESYVDKAEETMIELVKETEYHKRKGNWTIFGTIFSFLMLVLACTFVILSTAGVKSLSWFIDLPSIIIPLGITFFVLIASESLWDFGQAFVVVYGKNIYAEEQIKDAWCAMKTVLYTIPIAGVFTFFVSIIAIIGHLSNPDLLGPHLAVAILSVFYCSIIEILLIPTAVRLYKKLRA